MNHCNKLYDTAMNSLTLLGSQGHVLTANTTCPTTPSPLPKASAFPTISTLPDPFTYLDGKTQVKSTAEWYSCRQPEIMHMIQEYQYGYYPDHSMETVTATRTGNSLAIQIAAGSKTGQFSATINLPKGASASAPVPVVIAIGGIDNNAYLQNGIAVVTFDYSTVAADSNSKTGAFWSLYNGRDIGVLTAWAWGFHRTLDALILKAPEIDGTKVGVTGCSRLGKGALAAGIFDSRITLTMPMSSGVQGLGPYRYHSLSGQDETLENSKQGAGWWSDNALGTFVGQSERLPFDAHTIAAALAPRALIIDQGVSDPYTNSKGTAIVVFPAAKVVYDWLGVGSQIGMAIRSGGHCDMSGYTNVLPFVMKILKGTTTTRNYTDLSPWTAMAETYPWSSEVANMHS
ncbi:carbohydrate esterase family 15 protein [Glonium stellatum]|uniref:(4-O-methyl)-D-glucuronate--lignin esterase n=1 Tax=Glonium stellatum TaxID=574774 RepID=A0A8E2JR59_9PEZI|nr:carbohydrate esterase family 15 protein [Glonium stellatum]